jgi:hypothetical protein
MHVGPDHRVAPDGDIRADVGAVGVLERDAVRHPLGVDLCAQGFLHRCQLSSRVDLTDLGEIDRDVGNRNAGRRGAADDVGEIDLALGVVGRHTV